VAPVSDLSSRKRVEPCGGFRIADGAKDVAAADPRGLVSRDENASQHAAVVCGLKEARTELCRIKWKEKGRAG
jgi:hypothetical protein